MVFRLCLFECFEAPVICALDCKPLTFSCVPMGVFPLYERLSLFLYPRPHRCCHFAALASEQRFNVFLDKEKLEGPFPNPPDIFFRFPSWPHHTFSELRPAFADPLQVPSRLGTFFLSRQSISPFPLVMISANSSDLLSIQFDTGSLSL